jgi:hypothetical protein
MNIKSETADFMAMKGAGYYSKATTGARDAINAAFPLIEAALDQIPHESSGRPFRCADLGCADGGTSMGMWRHALARQRSREGERPIEIVYVDLPRNDFSQLFRLVHGQTETQSFYGEIAGVHPFASGTSFHQAIFPKRSVDFAFSATASHYISKVPCNITNHVHMVGASGEERLAYEEAGRIEWERFLALRAEELVPGGRLVLLNFGIDSQGRYLGHSGGVSMFDTFSALWQGLVKDGLISAAEFENTNFPQVYRNAEQFVAPLRDPASAVHRSGLRLEHIEERHLTCPYAQAFAGHGDAARFAREYIPTLRSWSEPTFASGLAPSRPAQQRGEILDEFYRRYERLVADNPAGHGMDYIHIHLICVKP